MYAHIPSPLPPSASVYAHIPPSQSEAEIYGRPSPPSHHPSHLRPHTPIFRGPRPPAPAPVIRETEIAYRQDVIYFFVSVESNSAYKEILTFQGICEKIINDNNIKDMPQSVREESCVYKTVEKMMESYNRDESVKLCLVGKECLSDDQHKFTMFAFKKDNRVNVDMGLLAQDPSSPFRPRRKDSLKRGKKVDKKSGKLRKNKRSKKSRV